MSHQEEEKFIDYSLYKISKRTPNSLHSRPTDIFVSSDSPVPAILKRISKLIFKEGHKEITLHGLGSTITKTIEISQLFLEDNIGTIKIGANTSTVTLIDDFIPLYNNLDSFSTTRKNSAIHIKIQLISSLES
eukprot:TRINITY_DN6496_c0_g1_i1.p1 TRINITY_DN6496_c0_g1~~TRINITY_DN6496_c0_g1_i1.p1  ORF type:complete len:133 (+),score=27.84 TRINITY_DN6496_c0_g1_i1:42-440(+)